MNSISRILISLLLVVAFLSSALPCGPGYTTPLFETSYAPDNPYLEYAAGKLGIVRPTFRRSVLFAAYRYIAGSGLSPDEQKAAIEVWNADLHNKDFADNGVEEAVKVWVANRKEVVGDKEETPAIYVERPYGGYDFFPNCARNAFETATETLTARISSHSASDANVKSWIKAQDQVFGNCSSGKQIPEPAPLGSPAWLQKDRDYQIAAASFYSMDYAEAKKRFAAIAQDTESPWQETAEYLVIRTLIREASLSKQSEASAALYDEAESRLRQFISTSGKFTSSAEGLMGLIKYRRHPKDRVPELAQILSSGGNERFRQDLIDYTWLLDKFETNILNAEEKRKAAEREKQERENGNVAINNDGRVVVDSANAISNVAVNAQNPTGSEIKIYLSSSDFTRNWTVVVPAEATDDEAIAAAEKAVGSPLTDEMKARVRDGRRSGYAARFSDGQAPSYEGGYYGDESLSPSLLPPYLRKDELTEWLFVYQMSGPEAYLHALKRYRGSGSELWLMTAIAKADISSSQLSLVVEAASNSSRLSPAYPTIAYHLARIYLAQGKTAKAREIIEDMLSRRETIPISTHNSFLSLRLGIAQTLDEFLRSSLKRPYAFDFDGSIGTIDDFIQEQKKWYDPEYNKDGREAYEAEIEERFRLEKAWQERPMFDTNTIEIFNQYFSTAALVDILRSPELPEYLHERFVIAIFTRAFLLGDQPTMLSMAPLLASYRPEMSEGLTTITTAKTPAARSDAALYFVIKNPLLSPYIEDGLGKTDNEFNEWDSNDWWCEPYDLVYDSRSGSDVAKGLPKKPAFLTAAQVNASQAERKRLKWTGNAPKFLADKVISWAARRPADKRVPEALFQMAAANGWTKYGCGNNEELRNELLTILQKRYPNSPWTAKLREDESAR